MGAAESNPVRNMDKRTARRTYRGEFQAAIGRFRAFEGVSEPGDFEVANRGGRITNSDGGDDGGGDGPVASVRVFVRKRPIFKPELKALEFDAVTVLPGSRRVVVHDARMHADMRRMLMNHHAFDFDRVFSERDNNEAVYAEASHNPPPSACRTGPCATWR